MFLSCFKATELIERKFHFKLSFIESMQLSIHKKMCNVCLQYEKQSTIIENVLAKQESISDYSIDINHFKIEILKQLEVSK